MEKSDLAIQHVRGRWIKERETKPDNQEDSEEESTENPTDNDSEAESP